MFRPVLLTVIVLGASLGRPTCGMAEGQGKGKSKGKAKGQAEHVVVFTESDRAAARGYWVEAYGRGNCPPGLAKKHNGCLPPGQAKKRYVVGRPLPATVIVQPLPPVLVSRVGRPPAGYEYVLVDGDLVKLAVGTRLVIDAISALVD